MPRALEDPVDFGQFNEANVTWEGTKTGVEAEREDASQSLFDGSESGGGVDKHLVS